MKAFRIILAICALLPIFAVPRLAGEMTLRGYETWEAITISLGMTLPVVVLLMSVLWMLDRRAR
ncbi:MAG: hypothetical protein U5K38_00560 [Woeseiaceae bacterium]|nr:hypothetical protein [Woeseiaceae bacterium]